MANFPKDGERKPCPPGKHTSTSIKLGKANPQLGSPVAYDQTRCAKCGRNLSRRSATGTKPPGPWEVS